MYQKFGVKVGMEKSIFRGTYLSTDRRMRASTFEIVKPDYNVTGSHRTIGPRPIGPIVAQ